MNNEQDKFGELQAYVFNSKVFMSDSFEANRIFLIDKLRVKIDKEGAEGKLGLIVTDSLIGVMPC